MDSVTQVALGSAVGYAVLGSKIGRKALLVGAAFGTLPDLDVLIDFGSDVENFVYHRSFSHSLIVQLFLTPILAWLLHRVGWLKQVSFMHLSVAILLIMGTHALLDSFTVYGTQLLWPLTSHPYGISSVFIIDPIYTLPLLLAVLLLCFRKMKSSAALINSIALTVSSLYLLWSIGAKWYIDDKIQVALASNHIVPLAYESTPSPFNTLLWRAVATTPNGHYEIYASLFDTPEQVSMDFYATRNDLLTQLGPKPQVSQLTSFTKGLFGVYLEQEQLVISDLRMGLEGHYVFSFAVAQVKEGRVIESDYRQLSNRPPLANAGKIFERITNPEVDLSRLGR